MATEFSKLLTELREKAGYPTAYKFYHGSGGKGVLKMSYRSYLMIEQGRILPVLARLSIFIWALRLTFRGPEANALVTAWLKTNGGEEAFNDLIAPMLTLAPAAPELSPMQRAMKAGVDKITACLSLEQVEAIHGDMNTYRCYMAFVNDAGAWTAARMAELLGVGAREAEKAMLRLAAVKIAKKSRDGSFQGPEMGMYRTYSPRSLWPAALREKILGQVAAMTAKGRNTYAYNMLFRADEKDLLNFYPVLDVDLKSATAFSVNRKTPSSGMFIVQASVTKLWDF
jgi:hypothetical protein